MIRRANIPTKNYYYITDTGELYSNYTGEMKRIKTQINNRGREQVKLSDRKTYTIHRLVAMAFIPNPNNLPEVNHIDGNPLNNHVENLEWCDRSYNISHAWETGLQPQRHASNCSLTQEEADSIRYLYSKENYSIKDLSEMYSVCKTTIKDILNGKYYNLNKDIESVSKSKTQPKLQQYDADVIRYIYNNYSSIITITDLSKVFEIDRKTVRMIIQGKRYKEKCND